MRLSTRSTLSRRVATQPSIAPVPVPPLPEGKPAGPAKLELPKPKEDSASDDVKEDSEEAEKPEVDNKKEKNLYETDTDIQIEKPKAEDKEDKPKFPKGKFPKAEFSADEKEEKDEEDDQPKKADANIRGQLKRGEFPTEAEFVGQFARDDGVEGFAIHTEGRHTDGVFKDAMCEEDRDSDHLHGGFPLCELGDFERAGRIAQKLAKTGNKGLAEQDDDGREQDPERHAG